jgi:SAM-dependent methyltransferase
VIKLTAKNPPSNRDGSLLDIGCGTGRHLEILSRSFGRVVGLDRSADMAALARARVPEADILIGSAESLNLGETFDVVTALFDVLSYQTSNEDIDLFFRTIRKHLAPDGVAIVDFWHLGGLINDPPGTRIRRGSFQEHDFLRISEANIDWASATTTVSITTLEWVGPQMINVIEEEHKMRAFLVSEISVLAQVSGLRVDLSGGWLTDQEAGVSDWHAYVTLRHDG